MRFKTTHISASTIQRLSLARLTLGRIARRPTLASRLPSFLSPISGQSINPISRSHISLLATTPFPRYSTTTMAPGKSYELPPVPQIPGVDYTRVPIEQFKAAVAKLVAEAWDETPEKIFAGVDTGKKGADLAVAIPRFKKGKPDDWAKKVLDVVRKKHGLS